MVIPIRAAPRIANLDSKRVQIHQNRMFLEERQKEILDFTGKRNTCVFLQQAEREHDGATGETT